MKKIVRQQNYFKELIETQGNRFLTRQALKCWIRSALEPLLDAPEYVPEIGTDIASSINSGVISGMMFEIDGHISRKPENICVFTGGDAIYFAKRRKNSIFVVCNLVLMGLALIALEYD